MKKIYFLATCSLAMCLSAYSIDRGIENGHAWVDLGLPSGTKWATCNVGARTPQGYGNHYAWGETTTKKYYDWNTYKYGSGENQLTKYCNEREYGKNGFTDNKTILDRSDDAAYINWGGRWRMPTDEDWQELYSNCFFVWTENYKGTGVCGYIVYKAKSEEDKDNVMFKGNDETNYSTRDTHIFLPAAGIRYQDRLDEASEEVYYWSSSLCEPYTAFKIIYRSYTIDSVGEIGRHCGLSVRPVRK